MTKDKIDTTSAVASARSISMKMPQGRPHRMQLMREIARRLQEKHGHFMYDQIYDIMEQAYNGEIVKNEIMLVQELDDWLSNDGDVEYLGDEGDVGTYRIKEV
ncbi:MAG: hypothetical protein ABIG20_01700 [archaeon]